MIKYIGLVLVLLFSCSLSAQLINNYGKACGDFNIYSAWQPVVGNKISFIAIAGGNYKPNDAVAVGLGFNEWRLKYITNHMAQCYLYTYPHRS